MKVFENELVEITLRKFVYGFNFYFIRKTFKFIKNDELMPKSLCDYFTKNFNKGIFLKYSFEFF